MTDITDAAFARAQPRIERYASQRLAAYMVEGGMTEAEATEAFNRDKAKHLAVMNAMLAEAAEAITSPPTCIRH